MSKKILITNFEMRQFAGSEINASTIAKRFKELGYEVYMLAMYFGEPLYAEVKENFDYIIDIKKNDFEKKKRIIVIKAKLINLKLSLLKITIILS